MNLHLRVVHGTLKRQDGATLGPEIAVHGKRFVIGSGAECKMRCPSSSISEYHCEIVDEGGVLFVRDLQSEFGTFLNGERIAAKRSIAHGDHLKVGKLEFEIVLTEQVAEHAAARKKSDPVGENISEMLAAADAEDRYQHLHDPTARLFKPPPAEIKPVPDAEQQSGKKRLVRPAPRPPGKLPPPPKIVADSTVNAAEEVLKKFFEKPKR